MEHRQRAMISNLSNFSRAMSGFCVFSSELLSVLSVPLWRVLENSGAGRSGNKTGNNEHRYPPAATGGRRSDLAGFQRVQAPTVGLVIPPEPKVTGSNPVGRMT